jgi:hypothetical protein
MIGLNPRRLTMWINDRVAYLRLPEAHRSGGKGTALFVNPIMMELTKGTR